MTAYTYKGYVLPETTRISASPVAVQLPAGPDYNPVIIKVQIADNSVTATCHTDEDLTEVGCATLRNIVKDIASSVCVSAALASGAWTIVVIDTCFNPDGSIRGKFSNASESLRAAYVRHKVAVEDIMRINRHEAGYFLRLALDDLNSGLIQPKFMRSHLYRSVESLRRSVAPLSDGVSNNQSWDNFRTTLGIAREKIELFSHHAERHGDYSNAVPMSGAQVDQVIDAILEIISSYIRWFKKSHF